MAIKSSNYSLQITIPKDTLRALDDVIKLINTFGLKEGEKKWTRTSWINFLIIQDIVNFNNQIKTTKGEK